MKLLNYFVLCFFFLHNSIISRAIHKGEPLFTLTSQLRQALPDKFIVQQDFSTGTYTITNPGTYALAENIQSTGSNGIVIASNNVTLDLNGHTLSTSNASANVINVLNQQNIVVRNGFISGGSVGLIFNAITDGLIQNVYINNGIGTNNIGIDITAPQLVIVDGCSVRGTQGSGSIGLEILYELSTESCIIKNSTFDSFATAVNVENGSTGLLTVTRLINTVFSNATIGFGTRLNPTVYLFNCSAVNVAGPGFNMSIGTSCILTNCIATNCTVGFNMESLSTILINCLARSNSISGFNISNVSTNAALINCIAEENAGTADGFIINAVGSIVKSCTSRNNSGRGFVYLSSGINAFTNNISYANNGGNFVNAPASSLTATGLTGAGSIQALGATYWWNVAPL